jgi:hypothetical protein
VLAIQAGTTEIAARADDLSTRYAKFTHSLPARQSSKRPMYRRVPLVLDRYFGLAVVF